MTTIRRQVFLRSLWPFVSKFYGNERKKLDPYKRSVNIRKIFNMLIKHYFNGVRFSQNQPVFVLRNKMGFGEVTSLYDNTHLLSKKVAKRFWNSKQIEYIFNTGQVSLRRGNELKLKKFINYYLNIIFERWKGQIDIKLSKRSVKRPYFSNLNSIPVDSLNYEYNEIKILEKRITRFFNLVNGRGIRINKDGGVSTDDPMYVKLYVIDGIPKEFTFKNFCGFNTVNYDTFNFVNYRRNFLTKFFPNFIKIS